MKEKKLNNFPSDKKNNHMLFYFNKYKKYIFKSATFNLITHTFLSLNNNFHGVTMDLIFINKKTKL